MQVINTGFSIPEYCDQMSSGSIVVNKDYQRTSKVWPPAARSYLIDTILLGYPIPKFSLYQKTDLKSRKTVKEIVDGQQRSTAILDYFQDNLKISGKSAFSGQKYSDLDEEIKQRFLNYQLSADLFVAATDEDIRQTFRRINSYTVPLNPEEQRHATNQGAFKWFIVEITERYATSLKKVGVFTERNLSRMQDAKLLTELILAYAEGIETYSKTKLDRFYDDNEAKFPQGPLMNTRINSAFAEILRWDDIHQSSIMKPFNFYSLTLAVTHFLKPVSSLNSVYRIASGRKLTGDFVRSNLSLLASALEKEDTPKKLLPFVDACSQATNTKKQREKRFKWFCKALEPRLLV